MSTSAASMKNIADMNFRLVLLLWLLNYSSAQDANCDYYQRLAAGNVAYINSPNYPNNYRPGAMCRWIVDCPVGFNCRLDCPEIRIPQSVSCRADRLLVSRSGDQQLNAADPYCGTGSISGVLSINRSLAIGLITSGNSSGGRFQCTVTTQATAPAPEPKCRCGERRQNRIVGGQETGVNEFTMMAGLVDLRIRQIKCGAVIISALHLVTAGHCVFEQSARDYAIVVGEHDVTTGDTSATAVYRINNYSVHPSYSESNYDNDIAVVFVMNPIVFSDLVQPVCMPFNYANNDFAGAKVTVVGWGTLFFGGPTSDVPMKVELDVLSQSTCRARGVLVTDRQMCTFTPGKDSCQDDSGGPLLWTNSGLLYHVGVISVGNFCASNTPARSTRVTAYLNWILSVTGTTQKDYCIK